MSHRILVVDRPEKVDEMIRNGLLYYPVEMTFSFGKKEALESIERNQPDLIISALQLADGTAVELVKEIKKVIELIPSIFLSDPNHAQDAELQQQILRIGAFDVLSRPFEMQNLLRKIDQAAMVVKKLNRRTRAESFIQMSKEGDEFLRLLEESRTKGIPVSELLASKQSSNSSTADSK